MTFRTFDIDTNDFGGATSDHSGADNAARNTRSRRRSAVMSRRSTGARIRGFGL
jgi:hypothetical protein